MYPPSNLPFTPNFSYGHSVILDAPLKKAFTIIGTEKGLEPVCGLSPFVVSAKWNRKDMTAIPAGVPLADRSVFDAPPATEVSEDSQLVIRHFCTVAEKIPQLFGFIHVDVSMKVTIAYLESPPAGPLHSVWENTVDGASAIRMWRLCILEEVVVEGQTKTKVTEEVYGWAPWWALYITKRDGYKARM